MTSFGFRSSREAKNRELSGPFPCCTARKTKCLASGINCGQRNEEKGVFFWSSTTFEAPPADETIDRPPRKVGENRIKPFLLQVAPRPLGAEHNTSAEPPNMSTTLKFPSAKKPILWLSGDQKGNIASSVPARSCGVREFRGR